MQWRERLAGFLAGRRRRTSAWGAMLDQQNILLAALSLQKTGVVRVMVYEHQHAPEGLVHLAERDDWLVQTLRSLGAHLPTGLRTMALALGESRCRHGVLEWPGAPESRRLEAEVQLEAAAAWGVAPEEVGFDFSVQEVALPTGTPVQQVRWAACLREELQQWQQHARSAGWRLPVVETEHQAARRAALHLQGDTVQHWAESPQDWQFSRTPERAPDMLDWPNLQSSPMWQPLVACGAALGALL